MNHGGSACWYRIPHLMAGRQKLEKKEEARVTQFQDLPLAPPLMDSRAGVGGVSGMRMESWCESRGTSGENEKPRVMKHKERCPSAQ